MERWRQEKCWKDYFPLDIPYFYSQYHADQRANQKRPIEINNREKNKKLDRDDSSNSSRIEFEGYGYANRGHQFGFEQH